MEGVIINALPPLPPPVIYFYDGWRFLGWLYFVSFYPSDADFEIEMDYIKAKVDAGADFIITQMFFDTAVYIAYAKACKDRYDI